MRCPKCGHDTRETAKFCDECGTSLQVTGPNRQFTPEPAKAHHIPEPERKHVTALFSDLTGYTAMTEKLDPEQVKEITGRIFDGIKQIVAKYEGFIERTMGDGVLAFFGIPRAHEDDPIRAIHSAMEIHQLVRQLGSQFEGRVGAALTMHSGINTGLVVTADVDLEKGTHGIAGDAVNVASRLSGVAGPDEIVVGAETVRRCQGRFLFQDMGLRQMKGKADPVPVFKVVSVMPSASTQVYDRQVYSEMVGRDRELDQLELQVMKVVNGEGSLVNVVGEPGIGKSRLIAELRKREVMKKVTLLEGRAISIGRNLSFHPIIDLLKQWADISENDSDAAAFDKLERSVRVVHPGEAAEIVPFVATLMGMKLRGKHAERVKGIEGEPLQKLIFKNLRELVIRSSELRPTVVIMEDLHWADASSLGMLEPLYRLAEKYRILFINVFRSGYWQEDDRAMERTRAVLGGRFMEMRIEPLDQQAGEALIGNMLDIRGLPYGLRLSINERAGGNPFFIEEVVRSLIDEGAIVRRNGSFAVTEKIHSVVIPPTINDLLVARLDRLEEGTRELVKMAAVIGRNFFDRVIKDVAASIGDIEGRLAHLKDIQLIRERTRMQELEYLFNHALAQEAAYESTLLEQRKKLHLRVAKSIEKLFEERLPEFYGMLAFHYGKGEDLEKAEDYMTKAGQEALRSSASSEALSYFRQALGLYVDRHGDRADPLQIMTFKRNLATAHFNRGQFAEALFYFDEILASKGYRSPSGKFSITMKTIADILAIAAHIYSPFHPRTRPPGLKEIDEADLIYMKVQSLWSVDNRRFFVETVSFVRGMLGMDPRGVPRCLEVVSSFPVAFTALGFFSLASRLLKYAQQFVKQDTDAGALEFAMTRSFLALSDGRWNSDPNPDFSLVDHGLRSGNLYPVSLYAQILCMTRVEQGMFDDIEIYDEKVKRITEIYAYDFGRVVWHHMRAVLMIKRGELQQALTEAESGLLLSDRAVYGPANLRFFGYRAICQALLGMTEEARLSVREGDLLSVRVGSVAPVFQTPYTVGRLLTHLQLLKRAVQGGIQSDILLYGRSAHQTAKQAVSASKKFAPYRSWILRLMGDYYWLVGKQRKALKWYDKSIREGERLGARPDLSRTYFEVGKRLLEPQSKYNQLYGIDAKDYLEKAEKLFREMGLEHDLDELERVRLEM